jgi:hypothetical protein
MAGRKAAFWLTVAGVSALTQFGLELAARKIPSDGLRRFVAFIHCGPQGGA